MPTPSLLIVPARFKTGKLYSQIPTANGDFTVIRDIEARRVGPDGLIASVASGIPRLDYYTSGGVTGCPALLVEPAATNLAIRSNNLSTAPNVLDASTTGTPFISPDGTSNAIRLTETIANDRHGFYHYATVANGVHTVSLFTKQTGRRYISFASDYTGTNRSIYFDLQTATTVSVGSGWTARIEPYADGWYRLSCTATAVSGSKYVIWGGSVSGTSNSYIGNTLISNTFYGLQIETGSVATSYIPTTAVTGSRSADVISVSGAVSGSIGQTAGVVYAQMDLRNWTASGRVLAISDGTSDARVVIQVGANQTLQAVVTAASGEVANIATASGQVNGIYKCAVAYASGDFAFYVNGNQIGTDSSGAVPACNNVALGKIETSASTNFLNDRILAGALYTTRLTNDELATLTTL